MREEDGSGVDDRREEEKQEEVQEMREVKLEVQQYEVRGRSHNDKSSIGCRREEDVYDRRNSIPVHRQQTAATEESRQQQRQ